MKLERRKRIPHKKSTVDFSTIPIGNACSIMSPSDSSIYIKIDSDEGMPNVISIEGYAQRKPCEDDDQFYDLGPATIVIEED
jgi:hypothetical protein